MLISVIEQIIEFESRVSGPRLVIHTFLKLPVVIFMTKQKSPRQIFEQII